MGSLRDELQSIYDARGELTPKAVVEVARNTNHPLHHRFEWDDRVAGERYRLVQASELIREVKVTYTTPSGEDHTVRAFTSVRLAQDVQSQAYKPTDEVLEDEFMRNLVLNECQREIDTLNKKYGHLKEYAALLRAAAEKAAS